MEILRVEHLTKRYGQGEAQVSALDDVSFCVEHLQYCHILVYANEKAGTLFAGNRLHIAVLLLL